MYIYLHERLILMGISRSGINIHIVNGRNLAPPGIFTTSFGAGFLPSTVYMYHKKGLVRTVPRTLKGGFPQRF